MTAPGLSFVHHFEPATDPTERPLLLLHGTGGNETDLLPLGRAIAPGAALLSPRGKVLENGMPRFFRRLSEGVFAENDVLRRALELSDFVAEARERYNIASPIALGYSNGANIAAALLLLRPRILSGAVLLRAMPPLASPPEADLAQKPILMLSGILDPIASAQRAQHLASTLKRAGAAVEVQEIEAGHQLTPADIAIARRWLASLKATL